MPSPRRISDIPFDVRAWIASRTVLWPTPILAGCGCRPARDHGEQTCRQGLTACGPWRYHGHLSDLTVPVPASPPGESSQPRPGRGIVASRSFRHAAMRQARTKKTYFSAKYRRLASTRGPMKAIIAVQHAMLIAARNLLSNGEFYRDPGPYYYTRRDPTKTQARALGRLLAPSRHRPLLSHQPAASRTDRQHGDDPQRRRHAVVDPSAAARSRLLATGRRLRCSVLGRRARPASGVRSVPAVALATVGPEDPTSLPERNKNIAD